MNTARKRVRVTLAATMLATVLGLCAGLLLGCGLALRQAVLRLQQDTGRLIAEENATLKESYSAMKQMQMNRASMVTVRSWG